MSTLIWSEKFSVGIESIDKQHKKLIDLINKLSHARNGGCEDKEIDAVLNELVNYTKTHFKNEEKMMQLYGYPEYNAHQSEHISLTETALNMQKKYYHGDAHIVTDIAILLNDWIADHILLEDKKYGPYLNSKGVI